MTTAADRAARIRQATANNAVHTGQARHQLGQLNDAQLATLVAWARKVHARLQQEVSHVPTTAR